MEITKKMTTHYAKRGPGRRKRPKPRPNLPQSLDLALKLATLVANVEAWKTLWAAARAVYKAFDTMF